VVSRRGTVTAGIGALGAYIDSFDLVMQVNERSPRTREMYADIVGWFAGWLTGQGIRSWDAAGKDELRRFFLHTQALGYAQAYRNNIGRCLQAFYKFMADEEQLPNPFDDIKPPPAPKFGENPPEVIEAADLARVLKPIEGGRDFLSRRDTALIRYLASTGCRVAEVAGLDLPDLDVRARTATVTGKGRKVRTVRFDQKAALALDRYQRARAALLASGRSGAATAALWIGSRERTRMTTSGIRQMVERRGEAAGMDLWPHLFRHTFSHNWLDSGGAEGDLLELNGWESAAMLGLYGRSARGARARRAYDRIDVMKGV
jgi:site-specific recombinase XerD